MEKSPPTADSSRLLQVPRNATRYRPDGSKESRPLAAWRELGAYVLLGDPGTGKSSAFKSEALACGNEYVTARDFIAEITGPTSGDEILFIDGLDEMRAGQLDGRVPFDRIRTRLHLLGRPRFRLSCREADWLGHADEHALRSISPGAQLEVLHLDPLTQGDIFAILRDRLDKRSDPKEFWEKAEQNGLTAMLGNPLLLDLTIRAVKTGWPSMRHEIYEAACRQLAQEFNEEHLSVRPTVAGDVDRLLDDAGLLCAVLLLSGKQAWSSSAATAPDQINLSDLPEVFPLHNAPTALASNVFTTVGGQSSPRHRSIAEFLAAKSLARRLKEGLPLGRLLALMLGFDGKPVEPLRGLFAWLLVHHASDRSRLIDLDPLGIILNGDVGALTTAERREMLEALNNAAHQDKWLRTNAWVSHPFGALATADMAPTFEALLRDPARDEAHQVYMSCVLDALQHGQPMPALAAAIKVWVEDSRAMDTNRLDAYCAWKHNAGFDDVQARLWLEDLRSGTLKEANGRLSGDLLADLYPEHLPPTDVLKYLRPRHRQSGAFEYSRFWSRDVFAKSHPDDLATLADAWTKAPPIAAMEVQDFFIRRLKSRILAAALRYSGDEASTERLCDWLDICLNKHGHSDIEQDAQAEVSSWLEARPQRIKQILEWGLVHAGPSPDQGQDLYKAAQRLHGARRPSSWFWWLLDIASSTSSESVAIHCVNAVARAVLDHPPNFEVPTMLEVEVWANACAMKWPKVSIWLEEAWSLPLNDWQAERYGYEKHENLERVQRREYRKEMHEPYWARLAEGTAPSGLLHNLAQAYDELYLDVAGETPEERVQDYLGSDRATAEAALKGLDRTLRRNDLPPTDEILVFGKKGKHHKLRPAALLAARRITAQDPDSPLKWPDELAERLVAFYLTDGTGDIPVWYELLARNRPELVAPILTQYAAPRLRRKLSISITGLWQLSREADQTELARMVLPALLEGFPARASEASRGVLNRDLLAGVHHLDAALAARIIRTRLTHPKLDSLQRISWLVADLPYRPEAAEQLAVLVGNNERRAVALGIALDEQGSLARTLHQLQEFAVGRLIEVLAPITPREATSSAGIVTVANHRADTLRGLFDALSSNPSTAARDELRRLKAVPALGKWTDRLAYAIRTQRTVAREAQFQAPSPRSVALTIANLAPANVTDLQALVLDHLSDIEGELRGRDSYLVKQFWRTESKRMRPQIENDCRDILLDKLRLRLNRLDVTVSSETRAAADKRCDMTAGFMLAGQRIAVPIEVKKEDHTKLWTAWRDQLQGLYTIDPAAGGVGIYLVLWFGDRPRASPEGIKPGDPGQLKNLLLERIPMEERSRLAVHVIDLSMPGNPA